MKIGVALSGCDIGAVGAYGVLLELINQGFEIDMISVSGLPSVTALPFAYGMEEKAVHGLAESFFRNLKEADMDTAVAELAAQLPMGKLRRSSGQTIPFALSAVDISDGKIHTFTDLYTVSSDRLVTHSLEDAYDALSATVSPADGLGSYRFHGCRLCDFSIWYGCPVHPLNMAGVEKIISVAFVPETPETPYEALVKHRLAACADLADIQVTVETEGGLLEPDRYIEIATEKMESCINEICMKMVF